MKQTLKELLKPPFSYDKQSLEMSDSNKIIFDFESAQWSDKELSLIVDFMVKALNEKWERDLGESLRWKIRGKGIFYYFSCPNCKADYARTYDHCPSCGQRLLPPID